MSDQEFSAAVSDHVERHVGPIAHVFHELVSPTVRLDVLRVDPAEERPWYTLVTCGMSARPMPAPEPDLARAELTLALPPAWPMAPADWQDERHYWPVRLLKRLGRLPHEYDTWLGEGHTIPNDDPPKPYAHGTALCGAIVVPPLLAPAAFAVLDGPAGAIQFYGVIPLHAAEMELKLRDGSEALYDRFDDAGVSDLLDPVRASVVAAAER